MNKVITALVIVALGFAVYSLIPKTVVTAGKVVNVEYSGVLDDGVVFDEGVFSFTAGSGQVIPGFDRELTGLAVGAVKTFTLEPVDAYGLWSDELIISMPFDNFTEMVGVTPYEGMILESSSGLVRVSNVTESEVFIDLNHELAGKSLTFTVKVLSIS